MPTLENSWYRRGLFFLVYMVEEIITIVTLSYFPMLFTDLGLDPRVYGVVGSLSLIPLVVKFFVGPISDRFPIPFFRGKHRGYFILGALINAITLPFLSLNPVNFTILFGIVWFLQTLGLSVMDIMSDTFAIEAKSIQNVKGRTGASLWMFAGVFVGGALATAFVPLLDWNLLVGLLFFSVLSIPPLLMGFLLKGKSVEDETKVNIREALRENLRRPFVKMGLIFFFLLNIDAGLLELTTEPYIHTTFGIDKQSVVAMVFFISFLGVILAGLGYLFIDKIQKPRLLMIINAIYVVPSVLLFYFIFTGTMTLELYVVLYAVFAAVSGLSYVTYTGLFFDLSDPKAAGTMIALYFSVTNLGMLLGMAAGGFLTMAIIYLITAIVCALRILPLARIKMEDVEKTFYQQEEK